MKRNNPRVFRALLFTLSLVCAFVAGWYTTRRLLEHEVQEPVVGGVLPASRYTLEQAEEFLGYDIPFPAYLPPDTAFEGVFVLPDAEAPQSTDSLSQFGKDVFEIRYSGNSSYWAIQLVGVDNRDEELVSQTGEVPDVFSISGEYVDINGSRGVMQLELNEYHSGRAIRSRLVWRFPYPAERSHGRFKALIFALITDSQNDEDLIQIARSLNMDVEPSASRRHSPARFLL